ncbi:MC155 [Molluscum contagiosum virus subtype 2]|uniref:MC155 n=2 Tax=Molluscum contagiosum virus TaxID=10279 RepID=A0A1S7DLY7_MCV2|nr:MC155 [Molluscum contagiosum virus subtype 2]QHW16546.1 MC155R [Molluscum contagiosum virus]AYO87791.1 MC155 [Molluscum contagiosum virus subtype 2]AYO87961.1 MC155 [Molluscum contagiosum virus subtype 2]AYO88131.1 MC155 [Molluscum contagiosum virus subtype 2]
MLLGEGESPSSGDSLAGQLTRLGSSSGSSSGFVSGSGSGSETSSGVSPGHSPACAHDCVPGCRCLCPVLLCAQGTAPQPELARGTGASDGRPSHESEHERAGENEHSVGLSGAPSSSSEQERASNDGRSRSCSRASEHESERSSGSGSEYQSAQSAFGGSEPERSRALLPARLVPSCEPAFQVVLDLLRSAGINAHLYAIEPESSSSETYSDSDSSDSGCGSRDSRSLSRSGSQRHERNLSGGSTPSDMRCVLCNANLLECMCLMDPSAVLQHVSIISSDSSSVVGGRFESSSSTLSEEVRLLRSGCRCCVLL